MTQSNTVITIPRLDAAEERLATIEQRLDYQSRTIDELMRRLNIYADQAQKRTATPSRPCSLCAESCAFCAQNSPTVHGSQG